MTPNALRISCRLETRFSSMGYHNVEEDLVWEAISVDLVPIREQKVKYLDELEDNVEL